ncbi:winged helix-turn-helix transcriptional regulator [Candidatus Microgenomates bacterium]|nr:winged helix-turn-helix transcriptional regulator [Candidatus Microgenomates bacterium]
MKNINPKQLERIVKGFANHHRIRILSLLEQEPDLSLLAISDRLSTSFKTIGEHTRKLAISGLIVKRYKGAAVEHAISDRGKQVLKFCRTLE